MSAFNILKAGDIVKFEDSAVVVIARVIEDDNDFCMGLERLVYNTEILEVVKVKDKGWLTGLAGETMEGFEFYHQEIVEILSSGDVNEFYSMPDQQLMMLRDLGSVDVNRKNSEYKAALERWNTICAEIDYRTAAKKIEAETGVKPTRGEVANSTYAKNYGGIVSVGIAFNPVKEGQ